VVLALESLATAACVYENIGVVALVCRKHGLKYYRNLS
jgi:hypothetical protein